MGLNQRESPRMFPIRKRSTECVFFSNTNRDIGIDSSEMDCVLNQGESPWMFPNSKKSTTSILFSNTNRDIGIDLLELNWVWIRERAPDCFLSVKDQQHLGMGCCLCTSPQVSPITFPSSCTCEILSENDSVLKSVMDLIAFLLHVELALVDSRSPPIFFWANIVQGYKNIYSPVTKMCIGLCLGDFPILQKEQYTTATSLIKNDY